MTLSSLSYLFQIYTSSFNGCFDGCSLVPLKEIIRLRKEINSLLSKEMSNVYLKVTTEQN